MGYPQAQRHNPLRPYPPDPSYDSLAPPSTSGANTPHSHSTASGSDASSAIGLGGGGGGRYFATSERGPGRGPDEREKHEVLYMGGTGQAKLKEDPAIVRKRAIIMVSCGTIVAAVVALAVLGVKGIV
ncbi:hypothetical protein JCM10212_005539 [Sporobolomyces blumeae]